MVRGLVVHPVSLRRGAATVAVPPNGVVRVLLLLPTATYRAPDFAAALGVEVVVGSEHAQAMARAMGDRALVVSLSDPVAAADAIEALHRRAPVAAVVAVDEQGVVAAATASERLGLRHNPPAAVAATRDKAAMRVAMGAAGLVQPPHRQGTVLLRWRDLQEAWLQRAVLSDADLWQHGRLLRASQVHWTCLTWHCVIRVDTTQSRASNYGL